MYNFIGTNQEISIGFSALNEIFSLMYNLLMENVKYKKLINVKKNHRK